MKNKSYFKNILFWIYEYIVIRNSKFIHHVFNHMNASEDNVESSFDFQQDSTN